MGILDSMAQQTQPQAQQAPAEQGGGMQQMYQFLMDNSMKAIAEVAAQRIQEKGPVEGVADLIATAMVSNLQAARQNGKTIPPQVMLQVAKDIGMNLLQQIGVPEDELDDVFIDVILRALELFGDMSDGMIPPEEEQQYVEMIQRIAQTEQQRQSQMSGNAPQEQMGGM
ncbi:TPA: hypothetical protein SIC63_001659 [Pasteurella multocida]|uniref:hypothetical protein n=1 Tax=Pasteurella multocida TaxID=747 RepID=UPI00111872B4|nr:hypothetical protein [Pasteurella multocida]QDA15161.1 hypothetical protein E0Z11_10030 [Pasteurella multocida subsp. multocida]MDY0489170.1 hypothetical protein [Pasteurella multocida]HEH9616560.1 hypothetical protein [Pasteurella multocida]HEH9625239.1 hypothetical protein [Pasteurella multocida]HEH9638269.1 hypothetical protein [Pasteurella multocida]